MRSSSKALISPTQETINSANLTTRRCRGRRRIPSYRHHKASGNAVVTLNGKDHYLGEFDTPASCEKYARLLAEWEANNRRLPNECRGSKPTITILMDAFWGHAKTYYRKRDGTPASELATFKAALRPLFRLYGSSPARKFGPLALKAVRSEMQNLGWSRSHINKQVSRIRMLFKWAVSEELIESSVYERLRSVAALKRGRCEARETKPIRPVPDAMLDAIEDLVSRQVWAIIRLQRLTGARAGEIVIMRPIDLDTSDDDCWVYNPSSHWPLDDNNAVCNTGLDDLLSSAVGDGSVNSDVVVPFVEQVLVPELHLGDVVIMNLSRHERARTRELIETAGTKLEFFRLTVRVWTR